MNSFFSKIVFLTFCGSLFLSAFISHSRAQITLVDEAFFVGTKRIVVHTYLRSEDKNLIISFLGPDDKPFVPAETTENVSSYVAEYLREHLTREGLQVETSTVSNLYPVKKHDADTVFVEIRIVFSHGEVNGQKVITGAVNSYVYKTNNGDHLRPNLQLHNLVSHQVSPTSFVSSLDVFNEQSLYKALDDLLINLAATFNKVK